MCDNFKIYIILNRRSIYEQMKNIILWNWGILVITHVRKRGLGGRIVAGNPWNGLQPWRIGVIRPKKSENKEKLTVSVDFKFEITYVSWIWYILIKS